LLVLVGLYVRLQLVETPEFRRSLALGETVRVPIARMLTRHARELLLGTLGTVTTFLVFYLMTVFALNWATTGLKFARGDYLLMQMIGVLFFGLTVPISAAIADRIGARTMLILATLASALASLFPTAVRYTGNSLTFNLAGSGLRSRRISQAGWPRTTASPRWGSICRARASSR
jgi:MFS family permease